MYKLEPIKPSDFYEKKLEETEIEATEFEESDILSF
jgi:hypothetical protein